MKRAIAGVVASAVFLTGLPARAEQHLVTLSTAEATLRAAVGQRQADITAVGSLLASPAGVSAAARVGIDARAPSARVADLSDEELRDLARRASILRTDPDAGGIGKTFLIIGIVFAVVVLIGLIVMLDGVYCSASCSPPGPVPPPIPPL